MFEKTKCNETNAKYVYFIMNNRRCSLTLKFVILFLLVVDDHGKTLKKRYDYCSIRVNGGLAEPQPLILCPEKGKQEFVYPWEPGIGSLVARPGESFRIACPGSRLNLNTLESYNDTLVTCVGDDYFFFEEANVEETFDRISCEKYPTYVARKTGVLCGDGALSEIGFPLTGKQRAQEFHRVIDLCHAEAIGNTLWAHAKIYAVIDSAQKSFPRTSFRKGNFFRGISIQKVYRRDSQRETLGQLLNSEKLAETYIPETGTYFLSRGHLIAKTDFVYGSHQRATFFYINAVPMWQNVNAGNWGTMEANVRSHASKRGLDFDVWAGGYGILRLEDAEGNEREIYLHVDKNGRRAVPVPKILFKVVYNYPTRSGIVFLTANNPYLKYLTPDYRICENVCGKIGYMTWNANRTDRGLSYCCEVDDFRQAFPNIPCFKTARLLL